MNTQPDHSSLGDKIAFALIWPFLFAFWCLARIFPLTLLAYAGMLAIGALAFFGAWPRYWLGAIGPTIFIGWALWHWFKRPAEAKARTSEGVSFLVAWAQTVLTHRACYALFSDEKPHANWLALIIGTFSAAILHVAHKEMLKSVDEEEDVVPAAG